MVRTVRIAQLGAFLALTTSLSMACGGGVTPVGGGSSGSSGSSGGIIIGRAPKLHRAEATACVATKPAENPYIPDGGLAECHSNAECTAGRNGRCDGNGHDGYRCTYDACYSDSECSGGGVCECNGASRATNNVCLVGECRLDADCGAGNYCSPTLGSCGHYGKAVGYYCHTSQDECVDDDDCAKSGSSGQSGYCAYEKSIGHWKCSTDECVGQRVTRPRRSSVDG